MISWKLWRALHRPPVTHPLYKRVVQAGNLPTPMFTDAAETIASLLVLPIIAFTGAVHGMGWAIAISCVIVSEQRQYTYDVLGLIPGGMLGASWSMSSGCLHRHRKFMNISSPNALLGRIALFGLIFLAFIPVIADGNIEKSTVYLFYGLAVLGAMIIDHAHSIVLSTLIGMLVPQYAISRTEPALGALFGCLVLQVSTYLAAALVIFVALPMLYTMLGISGIIADISVPLLGMSGFVALREFLIRQLWTALLRQLNSDTAEFDALLRLKV
jgi:hypothetical protein